ncbi:MAG: esterase lipase superfamily protein [Harvfovirus sp.]|uniref:Esterase lipase superfamily protein n=1 Tax=Harvfovirus sp. TaxID=2487768 RepID=A0A3G5A536_9VIRU|nr:MAG: esterase lipase superfamily protein [Harvfovirus sp.]
MGAIGSSCEIDSVRPTDAIVRRVLYLPQTRTNEFMAKWETADIKGTKFYMLAPVEEKGISVSVLKVEPQELKSEKIFVFSHGNGNDIYSSYPFMVNFAKRFGAVIICFDYPSYGRTQGIPNEINNVECLGTVVKHVAETYAADKIILMAHSLGTGVTFSYAAKVKWTSIIISISGYSSIPEVIIRKTSARGLLGNHQYPSITYIETLSCPIKLIHGEADEVINISHSYDLFAKCRNRILESSWLKRIGHNDILDFLTQEGNEIHIAQALKL